MAADPPAVDLRDTTPNDLDYVMRLEGDPANARFVTVWSRRRHLEAIRSTDEAHFLLTDALTDAASATPAGFLLFAGLENPHGSIELRRIVIERPGRGYGRAALRWAKRWAFDEQRAHRLWLDVKTFNAPARALYAGEGFIEEGTLRECERGPEGYESLVLMSILEPEYRKASHP